jgi:hypothetical protein
MCAFAMCSLTSPSLRAVDKVRAEDNLHSIYGIGRVPCATAMREILAPVKPERLRPAFTTVFRPLQRGKALEAMVFVEGHALLALDGTGYFSSHEIHCDSCLATPHRNGPVTYSPPLWGAALIHPDKREVIPLMPEAIVKPDGSEQNDGKRNAAKRFISKFRRDHPPLKVSVTEDSVSSNAPHIETLHAHDMRYILGVTAGNQAFWLQQVAQAEQAGRVTSSERDDADQGVHHRFRFVSDLPLNASNAALRVNVIEG